MDLTQRSASGAAVVGSAAIVSQGVAMVTSFVLARLLTPSDFGLLAMVAPIMVLVWTTLELGLSYATIQKKDLTHEESSLIFWVNLCAAVVGWAAVTAGAGLIAAFYGRPALRPLVMAYAGMFLLVGLVVQPRALLARRMQFRVLAATDLGSTLAGTGAAIFGALRGWGVWALIAQVLAPKVVQLAVFWIASGFWPARPQRLPSLGRMLAFGINLSAYRLLDQVSQNLDSILMGRVWGAAPAGYYSKARGLTQNPIVLLYTYLGTVMVPTLSHLQEEPRRLGLAYLRAQRALAAITFPVACGLFVLAPEAILLAYGGQWRSAIPIFRVLCCVSLFEGAMRSYEWVFVASGRTDRLFRCGLVAVPVICLSYLVGVQSGGVGVAVAFAIAWNALILPGTWYALRTVGLGPGDAARFLGPPLAAAILAGAGTWATLQAVIPSPQALVPRAAVGLAVMAGLYLGLVRLLAPGLVAEVRGVTGNR